MKYGKLRPQGKVLDHWQLLHESDFEDTDTVLLLHLDNNVTDYSNGAKTVTNSGVTFSSTAWKFTSHSAVFNGAAYLSLADSTDWTFGAGDFTVDMWIKRASVSGSNETLIAQSDSSRGNASFVVYINTTNYINFTVYNAAQAGTTALSGVTVADTNWHHIAAVRNGTNIIVFVDGVAGSPTSGAPTLYDSTYNLRIGSFGEDSVFFSGNIDELRIVKGTAKWTAAFTPPTLPYLGRTTTYPITKDRNNVLMISGEGANNSTTVIDECGKAITATGTVKITTAQKKYGASSIYFDGGTGYLSTPGSKDFYFGANDWTIDGWINFNSLAAGDYKIFSTVYGGATATWAVKFYDSANGNKGHIYFNKTNVVVGEYVMTNSWSPNIGQWYHFAFVRSGSNAYIFIDGVSQALTTLTSWGTSDVGDSSAFVHYMGTDSGGTYGTMWLDDYRISKGIARWTSTFTPPLKTTALINGDTDEEYKLVTKLSGIGSDSLYSMRFNSDSGSNYGYQRIYSGSTTIGASRGTGNTIYLSQSYVGSGEVCLNETLLYAKSGYVRTMLIQDESSVNGTTVEYMYNTGYSWNNTTAPVASVNLSSDISNGINIGSKIILYRKVT